MKQGTGTPGAAQTIKASPHPLTTGELSRMLRRFGIRGPDHLADTPPPGQQIFFGLSPRGFRTSVGRSLSEKTTHRHIRAKS